MIKLSTLLQRSADPSTRYSISTSISISTSPFSECMHAYASYMGTSICLPACLPACLSLLVCAVAHHRFLLFSLRDLFLLFISYTSTSSPPLHPLLFLRAHCITALMKLVAQNGSCPQAVYQLVCLYEHSASLDLHQR